MKERNDDKYKFSVRVDFLDIGVTSSGRNIMNYLGSRSTDIIDLRNFFVLIIVFIPEILKIILKGLFVRSIYGNYDSLL